MKFPTKGNKALAKKVIQLWTSFARTGTPSASEAPAWPAYEAGTQPYLVLDEEITTGTLLKFERCRLFEDVIMKNIAEK
jgi:carboxylesterase type B